MQKYLSEYIWRAVENRKGDDLERATRAFGGLSEKELDSEYGQSGRTRRAILADYQADRDLHIDAVAALQAVLPRQ